MYDIFGIKRRAREKHEAELQEKLAASLRNYNAEIDDTISEFTEVDFGKGPVRVRKQQIELVDVWDVNPGDSSQWFKDEQR